MNPWSVLIPVQIYFHPHQLLFFSLATFVYKLFAASEQSVYLHLFLETDGGEREPKQKCVGCKDNKPHCTFRSFPLIIETVAAGHIQDVQIFHNNIRDLQLGVLPNVHNWHCVLTLSSTKFLPSMQTAGLLAVDVHVPASGRKCSSLSQMRTSLSLFCFHHLE